MFDSFGVRFCPPILEKKPNFQNGQKSRKNGTNMDIILSFLAKSVDKHSITLVHITYPPLKIAFTFVEKSVVTYFKQTVHKASELLFYRNENWHKTREA